ncbi:MAG: M23 family metallopeptidase [Gammaproteobacteria bacterium]|jgi:murein DD-endopeptidase MepM/ murein hydrolase activator NlpD
MSTTADARSFTLTASLVGAWLACLLAGTLAAQPLYRYRDASGQWVYTDRQPDGEAAGADVEPWVYRPDYSAPEVTIERRSIRGGIALVARNTFFSHVQIAYRIDRPENALTLDGAKLTDNAVLSPRSETELLRIVPRLANEPMRFELSYQHIPGSPGVAHLPRRPYRLPFALASSWRVSQAWPSSVTHTDPSSTHAVDFAMPIGTGVYAARAGIVIEIADEYYSAGLDPDTDLARANIVRVLHDDGTMSLYAHLNWNSIRVRPGQLVERGEYLADSGNTGFSSGPHLHFVVQRNIGGAIESVPIEFAGAGASAVRLVTGDLATAY